MKGPRTATSATRTWQRCAAQTHVELDWCDGCEHLFFDRGELTAISGFADS